MADQTYRVIGGHESFESGEVLDHGERFQPTDRELELFPTKFEIVADGSESESESENVESADEQGADEFVDHNADDVAASIESGDADGHLAEVREAEAAGRDRVTVHDALDERADETGEDAGESGE